MIEHVVSFLILAVVCGLLWVVFSRFEGLRHSFANLLDRLPWWTIVIPYITIDSLTTQLLTVQSLVLWTIATLLFLAVYAAFKWKK